MYRVIGNWVLTDATTGGDIPTGLKAVVRAQVTDNTGVRAALSVDHSSTAGTLTIAGATALDAGTFEAEGYM